MIFLLGFFWKPIIFLKHVVAYKWKQSFFFIFTLTSNFKIWFAAVKLPKVICCRFFKFQFGLWCRHFGPFWSGTCFDYFFQKFVNFFPIIRSHWPHKKSRIREALLKGKDQYSWPPLYHQAQIYCFSNWSYIFHFHKTTHLHAEVNSTEPSLSVRVPWYNSPPHWRTALFLVSVSFPWCFFNHWIFLIRFSVS